MDTDTYGEPLVRVERITKTFEVGGAPFHALRGVSLEVGRGEMIAITGKSGSGKSTLLNLVAGIDRPTGGSVVIDGVSTVALGERELARFRGRKIGVVFQFFQLLPTLTVLENVMLPMDFCDRWPLREREPRALDLLERVGIRGEARKFPAALSGGQQQRAAIARALANDPPVVVADEPTGNLDSRTAGRVFELFREFAGAGKTVVVVTHERGVADWFDTLYTLEDGLIVDTAARRVWEVR